MHPNNKLKHKHIDTPLSLDALPDPAALKHQTFTFVGFYMLVYNAWKELELMPVLDDRQKRKDSLNDWMQKAEEHLPVWFSVRYLK
jgi:hypothetical protein